MKKAIYLVLCVLVASCTSGVRNQPDFTMLTDVEYPAIVSPNGFPPSMTLAIYWEVQDIPGTHTEIASLNDEWTVDGLKVSVGGIREVVEARIRELYGVKACQLGADAMLVTRATVDYSPGTADQPRLFPGRATTIQGKPTNTKYSMTILAIRVPAILYPVSPLKWGADVPGDQRPQSK